MTPVRRCGYNLRAPSLVVRQEMLDALGVGTEAPTPVHPVDRPIQDGMSAAQIGRHQIAMVQIGKLRA